MPFDEATDLLEEVLLFVFGLELFLAFTKQQSGDSSQAAEERLVLVFQFLLAFNLVLVLVFGLEFVFEFAEKFV